MMLFAFTASSALKNISKRFYKKTATPKTHNLIELLDLCKGLDTSLELLRTDLKMIDRYAVQVRYPGMSAEKDEARSALKTAQTARTFLRQRLGLD